MATRIPKRFALLARGERGDSDVAPPRALTRRMLRRPIELQPATSTQPRMTKRLIRVNFTPGRRHAIDQITDHVTEGTAASVVSWFNNSAAQASAHFQVRKAAADGGPFADIDQFVELHDKAWHNGRVASPTAPFVLARPGVNPNEYSVGIEHEGQGTDEMTPEQRRSSLWLHRWIAAQCPGVRFDREHVVGHHEVYAKKTCPGGISVDRIVRELTSGDVVTPAPTRTGPPPRVVWSPAIGDYLIVTRVVSDREWYYTRATQLGAGTRANVSLAAMPLQP